MYSRLLYNSIIDNVHFFSMKRGKRTSQWHKLVIAASMNNYNHKSFHACEDGSGRHGSKWGRYTHFTSPHSERLLHPLAFLLVAMTLMLKSGGWNETNIGIFYSLSSHIHILFFPKILFFLISLNDNHPDDIFEVLNPLQLFFGHLCPFRYL